MSKKQSPKTHKAEADEERAHYDWMGYIGNFIGLGALIPLPFAGYYLGREVYSASPVMGNIMMGGAFFLDIHNPGYSYWNVIYWWKLLFMEWYEQDKGCGTIHSIYQIHKHNNLLLFCCLADTT